MNLRIFIPLFLGLALGMPSGSRAGSYPFASPSPPIKARVVVHHHSVIADVSADSITVNDAAGSQTYKITNNTEITFKGETTTASQLQVGMRVQVTPDSVDPDTAGQISADDPPKDPAPRK